MPCANRSLLCHGLYHNGYLSINCLIFNKSENSDTFQFWHFPILTLSNSDTFQFWHVPILTLSNSDTFRFRHFPILSLSNFFQNGQKFDSDTFQFWHFLIPRWELTQLKMIGFNDCTITGTSILTSVCLERAFDSLLIFDILIQVDGYCGLPWPEWRGQNWGGVPCSICKL